MKDLEPSIYRQRLIIEGIYTEKMNPKRLRNYLEDLSKKLKMTIVYGPIVKNLAERINPIHKGYESVMIWAESGTSVYTWNKSKFFTADIYSCKKFDVKKTIEFTEKFFKTKEIVFKEV